MTGTTYIHRWQDRGIGVAPYRCVGVISLPSPSLGEANPSAYENAMREATATANAFGVHVGSCDVCGMGLMNNFVIEDATGWHFVVGCDCVAKTDDSKLVTDVEARERNRKRAIAEAKRDAEAKARYEARRARIEAEEAEQRKANGGMTDAELRAKEAEEAARRAVAENAWLIDVLRTADRGYGFVSSILAELRDGRPFASLPDRALSILAEIYAKESTGKSIRSKVAQAAIDAFWSKVEAAREAA